MDVVINSQIQSPLVRTLARTKGKSQSFTHSIADNVPPCSFTKIVLSAQNAGESATGRNYKIKIPQYGYLRDVNLRFTFREQRIDPAVVKIAQEVYTKTTFFLDDVQAVGSYQQGTGTLKDVSGNVVAQNLSWYNLQSLLGTALSTGAQKPLVDQDFSDLQLLAPQFKQLLKTAGYKLADGTTDAAPKKITSSATPDGAELLNGQENVYVSDAFSSHLVPNEMQVASATMDGADGTKAGPYTQALKINGNPELWSQILRFYYNIYKLSKDPAGRFPIAKMIWEQLKREPTSTVPVDLYMTCGQQGYTGMKSTGDGDITTKTTTLPVAVQESAKTTVDVTPPRYCAVRPAGGELVWIPKLPMLIFDSLGTVVGVDFIEMNLMHPDDKADDLLKTYLMGDLKADKIDVNYRKFQIDPESEDFDTWDWQTESQYYRGMAANVASTISLTTHNRPIQTIFPLESYIRIQRMPQAERIRYLKMMEAKIIKQGNAGDATATNVPQAGEKVMYFPTLLSSTENPSYNFDTRFVEQLDLDVTVQPLANIFTASDTNRQAITTSGLFDFAAWIRNYRSVCFEWLPNGDPADAAPTAACIAMHSDLATKGVQANPAATQWNSYIAYAKNTPKSWVLSLRTNSPVPEDYIKVEALAYFHNFHDRTAQAIRDANFKPNTPASLLQYNTYAESERPLAISEINGTVPINMNITTNNLVFGTTFLIRRRALDPLLTGRTDHYMNTLPVQEVTLTASGQQIYHSKYDESALTDVWDYDLASGKVGRKYNNATLVQSRVLENGEEQWLYHIPYCFSSDMTYNSGSIAFQTLNNPVLSVVVDFGKNSTQGMSLVGNDNDFSIQVFHNYWNMIRIDSNTGAITRSLDL